MHTALTTSSIPIILITPAIPTAPATPSTFAQPTSTPAHCSLFSISIDAFSTVFYTSNLTTSTKFTNPINPTNPTNPSYISANLHHPKNPNTPTKSTYLVAPRSGCDTTRARPVRTSFGAYSHVCTARQHCRYQYLTTLIPLILLFLLTILTLLTLLSLLSLLTQKIILTLLYLPTLQTLPFISFMHFPFICAYRSNTRLEHARRRCRC